MDVVQEFVAHVTAETERVLAEKLGADVLAKARAEIEQCIPGWVRDSGVRIDADGITALMLVAWARGWSARCEAMS